MKSNRFFNEEEVQVFDEEVAEETELLRLRKNASSNNFEDALRSKLKVKAHYDVLLDELRGNGSKAFSVNELKKCVDDIGSLKRAFVPIQTKPNIVPDNGGICGKISQALHIIS